MAELEKFKAGNKKASGKQKVEDSIFSRSFRPHLLHEYTVYQGHKARQGTHSTLTRSEVSGTTKKPFRQKGTGNARQGSLKGPSQYGGGRAFAVKPRSYGSSLNKKTRKEGLKEALSQKNYEKNLAMLEGFEISSGKTKDAWKALESFGAKSILIVGHFSPETWRATRNMKEVSLLNSYAMNVRDLLKHEKVFLTEDALAWIDANLKTNKEAAA